jgi:hypothetical protein
MHIFAARVGRLDKHSLPGIVAGESASMPLSGIAMQAA